MSRSVPPEAPHRQLDVDTPRGTARCYIVDESAPRRGTLVLGHGAGKGTNTPDLHGLLDLQADGWRMILVDQPWVLEGRKLATRPPTLDEAWVSVIAHLRDAGELTGEFVVGGRSAGARVACRTAQTVGADRVLALAFPLAPPRQQEDPSAWRTEEAAAVVRAGIPLTIVQGRTDGFGGPNVIAEAVPRAEVIAVHGGHGFAKQPDDVIVAVRESLQGISRG